MILRYPKKAIQMEQNEQWGKAAEYLYDVWRINRSDINNLLTAGLEQWYYMTIYEPSTPFMDISEVDLCMRRLSEIMRFWTEHTPSEAACLALFGYCMKVQPFWFCLDSKKVDIDMIRAKGIGMIEEAHALFPDDDVISAIANDSSIDFTGFMHELNQWDNSAIQQYFLSVLGKGQSADGSHVPK